MCVLKRWIGLEVFGNGLEVYGFIRMIYVKNIMSFYQLILFGWFY